MPIIGIEFKCHSLAFERWLAMIDILGTCFELAWVVFTECKQTSGFHVCDWTNETGLCHGAVTTNIILPTGILSVLSRNFGISYINNFLSKSANILILCMVRRTCIKTQNNPKQTRRKLISIFNDLFSLFLCPPNCLYTSNCSVLWRFGIYVCDRWGSLLYLRQIRTYVSWWCKRGNFTQESYSFIPQIISSWRYIDLIFNQCMET